MVNEVMDLIEQYDPEVGRMVKAECDRQRRNLELIASENIVSEPVMAAMEMCIRDRSGPKARSEDVVDGQQVEIPVPRIIRTVGTQKDTQTRE